MREVSQPGDRLARSRAFSAMRVFDPRDLSQHASWLVVQLTHPDARLRYHAARHLRRLGEHGRHARAKVEALLDHETAAVRSAAQRILDAWGPAESAAAVSPGQPKPPKPSRSRDTRATRRAQPKRPPNRSSARNSHRTAADYEQHVMRLKRRLPSDSFTIVVQRPFVVIGDEPPETVRRRAEGTVKWSVDRLKRDYFTHDPDDIIDIWLFKDKASYEKNAQRLFDERPTTPYGYYSREHKALIMNIATGGGTLVHEIVHPFMAANFPKCPSWFNEGLASLYEQCGDRSGHIYGYTNWRLNGLQRAIRADTVPTFRELCGTSRREFYHDDPGTNYSQARYLCYYLQERGLLVKYYHEFRRTAKDDPTGYRALQRVMSEKDMGAFKKRWEQFVLQLRRD